MKLRKKYKWSKMPSGNYSIWDVEVFRAFTGPKEGETLVVTPKMISEIVQKNKINEQRNGEYLRAFEGHHDGYSNRPGVGFLDGLRVGQDSIVFSNLVEIPEEKFRKIRALGLPYRSPEYDYDTNTLTGLALLESQKPYFSFPMLVLEEQESPRKIYNFQFSKFLRRFQLPDNLLQTESGGISHGEPLEYDKSKMKCFSLEEDVNMREVLGEMRENLRVNSEAISKIADMLQQLLGMESEEAEMQGRDISEVGQSEGEEVPKSSVAYQESKEIRALRARISALEGQQSIHKFSSQAKNICLEKGIPFEKHVETIQRFSTDKDRGVYLEALRAESVKFQSAPEHRISSHLRNFVSVPVGKENEILKKFSAEDYETAKLALETYVDTANARGKSFLRRWGETPDKFVESMVAEERLNPGYLRRTINPV